MNPTEEYIQRLEDLKPGELALLRTYALQDLDESVHAFDLFTGIWWPLRQKNERTPRRQVAWLIAKLFAFRRIIHSPGDTIAWQLRRCRPNEERTRNRIQQKFDEMLTLPLDQIEPALQWALELLDSYGLNLDWVRLTDDLSIWERESTRLRWAEEFMNLAQEDDNVDRNTHDSESQPSQP
ncbi:MAG: type I-E CRISPR-associated protein Cse2/CasB [candidate division WOR-3 bacterium]